MSAISQCFQNLQAQQGKALIPFITAGDPDLATTLAALQVLNTSGADLIELGVPYSDPLADGPVIQAAATRALSRGINLTSILSALEDLHLKTPLILFTYFNPIYQLGIPRFLQLLHKAGCQGLVVPDLPLEESGPLITAARDLEIDVILLVAPTSTPARMQAIAQQSSGFIYLVSTTGVTGQRRTLAAQIPDLIQQLRLHTSLPIGVGFGISSPEQAHQVIEWGADAAIVGSAFVQRLAPPHSPEIGLQAIAQFCQELKAALV